MKKMTRGILSFAALAFGLNGCTSTDVEGLSDTAIRKDLSDLATKLTFFEFGTPGSMAMREKKPGTDSCVNGVRILTESDSGNGAAIWVYSDTITYTDHSGKPTCEMESVASQAVKGFTRTGIYESRYAFLNTETPGVMISTFSGSLLYKDGLKVVVDSGLTEIHWSNVGDSIVSKTQSKIHLRLKDGLYLSTLVMVADKNTLPDDAVAKLYEGPITHQRKKAGMMEIWTAGVVKIKDSQGRPF